MGQPCLGNAGQLRAEFIGAIESTRGSEISQYPLEKKANSDFPSSDERTGNSLNRPIC